MSEWWPSYFKFCCKQFCRGRHLIQMIQNLVDHLSTKNAENVQQVEKLVLTDRRLTVSVTAKVLSLLKQVFGKFYMMIWA